MSAPIFKAEQDTEYTHPSTHCNGEDRWVVNQYTPDTAGQYLCGGSVVVLEEDLAEPRRMAELIAIALNEAQYEQGVFGNG